VLVKKLIQIIKILYKEHITTMASAAVTCEEMEMTTMATKYLEEREEVLDRLIDIIKYIKKLNIPLVVDYPSITDDLKTDFNKMNAYHLIESMQRDSQLQANEPLFNIIKTYSKDIMSQLDYITV